MAEGIRHNSEKDTMEIDSLIKEIDTLKPVSHVGQRAMRMIYDPDSSLREIVDILKFDQGMTANLLRVCNSSYFGLKNKVVSIQQAIALLGAEKVACLMVMGASADNFKRPQRGYDLEVGELWRYSVSSALIAREIAEKKKLKDISHLFTSALLKDIGKVILTVHVGDAFEKISDLVQNRGLSFIEAEKETIGVDHAELGARIAEKWNFDTSMVLIIRHHHEPDKSPPDDLSLPIVYLADIICMMAGVGVGSDGLAYRHYQETIDRLAFTDVDIQKIIADYMEKLKSVEELVNLSGGVG